MQHLKHRLLRMLCWNVYESILDVVNVLFVFQIFFFLNVLTKSEFPPF